MMPAQGIALGRFDLYDITALLGKQFADISRSHAGAEFKNVQVSQGNSSCGHDSTKSSEWEIRISLKPRSDAKPLVQKASLLGLIFFSD